MAEGTRNPNFWLRLIQLIFGIIAFATVAEWADYSRYGYMVFVGSSTIVVTLVFMLMYLRGAELPVMAALGVDGLWWIFWLVGAALMSDELNNWYGPGPSRLKASVAFSWLTWFFFTVSCFIDFMAMRGGGGPSAPTAPATV